MDKNSLILKLIACDNRDRLAERERERERDKYKKTEPMQRSERKEMEEIEYIDQ